MIKEYIWAKTIYDEQLREIHCIECGHAMPDDAPLLRMANGWTCESCVERQLKSLGFGHAKSDSHGFTAYDTNGLPIIQTAAVPAGQIKEACEM